MAFDRAVSPAISTLDDAQDLPDDGRGDEDEDGDPHLFLVPALRAYGDKLKAALRSAGELQARALWELIEIVTIGSEARIVTEDIAIW